jgi:hypothetical protein
VYGAAGQAVLRSRVCHMGYHDKSNSQPLCALRSPDVSLYGAQGRWKARPGGWCRDLCVCSFKCALHRRCLTRRGLCRFVAIRAPNCGRPRRTQPRDLPRRTRVPTAPSAD